MATTPRGFRYPAITDAPNVPQDIRNLAEDIDTYYAPATKPVARLTRQLTTVSVPHDTPTNVAMDTVLEDPSSMAGAGFVEADFPGLWLFSAVVTLDGFESGYARASITRDGTTVLTGAQVAAAASGVHCDVHGLVRLSVAGYDMRLVVHQTSGGTVAALGRLDMTWLAW